MTEKSPLAPERIPILAPVAGARLAAVASGIKYRDRTDLCLIELAENTAVAGVLTKSSTAAAPVDWCRTALKGRKARAIVVNSGNANAFNGAAGMAAVQRTAASAAALLGCAEREVFVASTGVIGEPLPVDKIEAALAGLHDALISDGWAAAADAILTTDTYPKLATAMAEIDGQGVTINGIAKGSGMIHPNMATMLAFIVTDAAIGAEALQALLSAANERSFNAITVDGDTSTSDVALLCATGQAGHEAISDPDDPRAQGFRAALDKVMIDLAQQIVRDGEGASKFVTISVHGGATDASAKTIALAIANSPLVKTAIAGEDANWGRIVMAVGKSGEPAEREKIAIAIGGHAVAQAGSRVPGYDESPIAEHMKGEEIQIEVDVGVGDGTATVWTCDLTHGYISINADYRS